MTALGQAQTSRAQKVDVRFHPNKQTSPHSSLKPLQSACFLAGRRTKSDQRFVGGDLKIFERVIRKRVFEDFIVRQRMAHR